MGGDTTERLPRQLAPLPRQLATGALRHAYSTSSQGSE